MKRMFLYIILLTLIFLVIALYLIPTPGGDFMQFYGKKDKAAQSLVEFRKQPVKTVESDGVTWKYYSGGNGPETIVFAHGMGGSYDLWWQQIEHFAPHYRVISYTLPEEIDNLKDVAKGITAILKKENVDKFNIVGTSMGGYIAQYLIKTMPDRIDKAVFGNTFPPNHIIAKENERKSKLIKILPTYVIHLFGDKQLHEKLLPTTTGNKKLLEAFLRSLPFSKKAFLGRYAVVIDYFDFDPNREPYKKIPKLIIQSDNDPLITPELRKKLIEKYPDAEVYTFHKGGHLPYIAQADKYNEALENFLKKSDPSKEVRQVLQNYIHGRQRADSLLLKKAFWSDARIRVQKDALQKELGFHDYLTIVLQAGPTTSKADIDTIVVNRENGTVTAKLRMQYDREVYHDSLLLVSRNNQWRIAEKFSVAKEINK